MYPLFRTRSRRPRKGFVLVERPTPEVIAGLAAAGAIMARADGQIDPAERSAWLAFLREQGLLAHSSRREVLASFDEAARKLDSQPLAELCTAAERLAALAGTRSARLIGMAASRVAMADGIAWPQEIAMLQVIRDKLGLSQGQRREAR